MRRNTVLAVLVLVAATRSGAMAEEIRGRGPQPAAMRDLIQDLTNRGTLVRSAAWTTDGGRVVIFDGGIRGGGPRPAAMNDFIQAQTDKDALIRSVFWTTDGGWFATSS